MIVIVKGMKLNHYCHVLGVLMLGCDILIANDEWLIKINVLSVCLSVWMVCWWLVAWFNVLWLYGYLVVHNV